MRIWLHCDETMALTTSSSNDKQNVQATKIAVIKKLALSKETTSGTTTKFPSLKIAFFSLPWTFRASFQTRHTFCLCMLRQMVFSSIFSPIQCCYCVCRMFFFRFWFRSKCFVRCHFQLKMHAMQLTVAPPLTVVFIFRHMKKKNHNFDFFVSVVSTYVKGSKRYNKVPS